MCGIVLAINLNTWATRLPSWLKDAMIASQVRGTHATGMFQLDNTGLDIHKRAVCASEFVQDVDAGRIIGSSASLSATVGHVRHATAGSATDDANAHPFVVEREDGSYVVGVHNGSLYGWDREGHSVDSDWAFHQIAAEGVDAFEKFDGAFCFVWHDSREEDKLYIARNSQRPFHFTVGEDGKTLLGCSEAGMLEWLNEKHGFKAKDGAVFSLEEGKLYTFDLKTLEFTKTHLPSFRRHATVIYPTRSSYYDAYDEDVWDDETYYSTSHYSRSNTSGAMRASDEYGVIEAIKKSLKSARYSKLDIDSPPIEASDTDEGKTTFDLQDLAVTQLYTSTPNMGLSTSEQQKAAKEAGVFGQLVIFEPLVWDDQDNSLMGEIVFADEVDGELCISRMDAYLIIPEGRAKEVYLAEEDYQEAMCVVGVDSYTQGSRSQYAVISELNASQRELLHNVAIAA